MAFIDTHCHLDLPADRQVFNDIEGVLERAMEAGVGKIINVGTSVEGSKKSVEIAEKYSKIRSQNPSTLLRVHDKFGMTEEEDFQIFASVGIHPQDGKKDVQKYGNAAIDELRKIAKSSKKVVAIGEIGLDYYLKTIDPSTSSGQANKLLTTDKEKEFQRKLFVEQITLARELNLPILVHCRNGWEEIFDLIANREMRTANLRGLFHSWTGDWEAAQKALDLGFYISFSGIVTFKNAPNVQEVAKKVPLERMLIETDSPFLSPEPYRGKTNEPKNVTIVGKFIASIRNQPADLIASQTTANAEGLFGLK